MGSIIFIFVLSVFLQTMIFRYCITTKIFSYIDSKVAGGDVIPEYLQSEMNTIYLNNYSDTYEEKNDPVCNLSNDNKKALCDLIFKYHKTQFGISETALYLSKLLCKRNRLILKDRINKSKVIMQNMYPCYGRHEIIWTSFIEDIYYNFYYLSSGPNNSITVYVELIPHSGYYRIANYFYNVDLSKLQYVTTGIKSVIRELNTMKTIFTVATPVQALILYKQEMEDKILNGEADDPVCRLEYEKKMRLCEIVLNNSHILKERFKLALNKSAAYLYNMSCVIKLLKIKKDTINIATRQKLYPCPVKFTDLDYPNEKFLIEKFVNIVFLSSSLRRNAVFMFLRNVFEIEEKFMLTDLIGNIDLKNIKSTVITTEELTAEFKDGYSKIKEITDNIEKLVEKELSSVLMSCTTEKQENEMIEQLFFMDAEQKFSSGLEKTRENIKRDMEQILKTSISGKEYSREAFSSVEFELGPQVFKRLLKNKKLKNLSKESSLIQEWLVSTKKAAASKKSSRGAIDAYYFRRIKKEVQQLISKMEISVFKMTEENLGQDRTNIYDKQLKTKSKKKEKKK